MEKLRITESKLKKVQRRSKKVPSIFNRVSSTAPKAPMMANVARARRTGPPPTMLRRRCLEHNDSNQESLPSPSSVDDGSEEDSVLPTVNDLVTGFARGSAPSARASLSSLFGSSPVGSWTPPPKEATPSNNEQLQLQHNVPPFEKETTSSHDTSLLVQDVPTTAHGRHTSISKDVLLANSASNPGDMQSPVKPGTVQAIVTERKDVGRDYIANAQAKVHPKPLTHSEPRSSVGTIQVIDLTGDDPPFHTVQLLSASSLPLAKASNKKRQAQSTLSREPKVKRERMASDEPQVSLGNGHFANHETQQSQTNERQKGSPDTSSERPFERQDSPSGLLVTSANQAREAFPDVAQIVDEVKVDSPGQIHYASVSGVDSDAVSASAVPSSTPSIQIETNTSNIVRLQMGQASGLDPIPFILNSSSSASILDDIAISSNASTSTLSPSPELSMDHSSMNHRSYRDNSEFWRARVQCTTRAITRKNAQIARLKQKVEALCIDIATLYEKLQPLCPPQEALYQKDLTHKLSERITTKSDCEIVKVACSKLKGYLQMEIETQKIYERLARRSRMLQDKKDRELAELDEELRKKVDEFSKGINWEGNLDGEA